MNKKAFTLVELIVVITILAILATIGFVSFSGYLAGTRDTNRISQLKSMADALELYRTKKDLPIPDDKVDILAGTGSNEKVIAYQGNIGANVLETIEYTEKGLDPKDKTYFGYYLIKDKRYFQLLAFLEEPSEYELASNTLGKKASAVDYSSRYPRVQGRRLGILTDENNTPINEISNIASSGSINIETTTESLVAHVDNESNYTEMEHLAGVVGLGGIYSSCKSYLEKHPTLSGKDGYYLLFSKDGEIFPTYCNMTLDGGGWTLLLKADGNNSTFEYESSYWEDDETLNEYSTDLDGIEYKSRLFSTMKFTQMNVVIDTAGVINNQLLSDYPSNSLKEIFNRSYQTFPIDKADWLNLVDGSRMQDNCNQGGVNVRFGHVGARIGFSSNEQNDCNSNDSSIGMGLKPQSGGFNATVGNNCKWCFNGGVRDDQIIKSLGYLYVR